MKEFFVAQKDYRDLNRKAADLRRRLKSVPEGETEFRMAEVRAAERKAEEALVAVEKHAESLHKMKEELFKGVNVVKEYEILIDEKNPSLKAIMELLDEIDQDGHQRVKRVRYISRSNVNRLKYILGPGYNGKKPGSKAAQSIIDQYRASTESTSLTPRIKLSTNSRGPNEFSKLKARSLAMVVSTAVGLAFANYIESDNEKAFQEEKKQKDSENMERDHGRRSGTSQ